MPLFEPSLVQTLDRRPPAAVPSNRQRVDADIAALRRVVESILQAERDLLDADIAVHDQSPSVATLVRQAQSIAAAMQQRHDEWAAAFRAGQDSLGRRRYIEFNECWDRFFGVVRRLAREDTDPRRAGWRELLALVEMEEELL